MPVAENRPHVQLQLGTGTVLALLDTRLRLVSISEESAAELA